MVDHWLVSSVGFLLGIQYQKARWLFWLFVCLDAGNNSCGTSDKCKVCVSRSLVAGLIQLPPVSGSTGDAKAQTPAVCPCARIQERWDIFDLQGVRGLMPDKHKPAMFRHHSTSSLLP
jgi:hypothetical protein